MHKRIDVKNAYLTESLTFFVRYALLFIRY